MNGTVPGRMLAGKSIRLVAILALLWSLVGGLPVQPAYAGVAAQPPVPQPCPPPTAEGHVVYGCNDLSRNLQDARLWLNENKRGQTDKLFQNARRYTSNYAIARLTDGTYLIGHSDTGRHAEQRLLRQAQGQDQRVVWDPRSRSVTIQSARAGTIDRVYTELQPCERRCAPALRNAGLQNRTTWSWRWNPPAGATPAERKEVQNAANNPKTGQKPLAIRQLFHNGAAGPIPDATNTRSGVTGAIQRQTAARGLGGIDFSSIQLRYVSDGGEDGNTYSFRAPTTPGQDSTDGMAAILDAFESLNVWMTLEQSKFWVNLNPEEPDRIIDPDLAATDVGHVLLQADLDLKRSWSNQLDPNTEVGAEFWDRMDAAGLERFCVRNWIVPGQVTVRDTGSELYILEAPLEVMSESEFFEVPGGEDICPADSEEAVEIFQDVILPEVIREVNESPEYTDLRRVYISRIAAEWYRQRITEAGEAEEFGIDSNDASIFESPEPWDPNDIFDEYVDEINGTEFTGPDGRVVITGGVDFTEPVAADRINDANFQNTYPQLPAVVEESVEEVTITPDETNAFAGGVDMVPPLIDPPGGGGGGEDQLPITGTPIWAVVATGALLIAVGLFAVWRWRNRTLVFQAEQ